MIAELVTIGDEILIGQIVNTNSVFLSKSLNSIGIAVSQITSISDKSTDIINTVERSRKTSDIIIITGGLGFIGSHTVVELMRQGNSPQKACEIAVERIIKKHDDLTGLQVGFLALDKFGNVGAHSVYYGFNYAAHTEEGNNLVDASFDRNWD